MRDWGQENKLQGGQKVERQRHQQSEQTWVDGARGTFVITCETGPRGTRHARVSRSSQ